MGLCARLRLLHRHDVHPAGRIAGEAPMKTASRHLGRRRCGGDCAALSSIASPIILHILVLILIWSFAYTSWSIHGPFSDWCRWGMAASWVSAPM